MSLSIRAARQLPNSACKNSRVQRRFFSQSCSRLQTILKFPSSSKSAHKDKEDEQERKHIHITGLPRSATPADVMRLARQAIKDNGLAKNIACARLDYDRFIPTGNAFLSMTSGFYARPAAKALRDTQLSSLPLKAYVPKDFTNIERRRGARGLKEGAERGAFDGTGYGAGIDAKGCDVVLFGLPGTIAAPALRLYLRRMGMVKLALNGEPDCDVIKIDLPKKGATAVSKHLVRLNSPAEAHSFVRKMHMTFFLPEVWQQRYLVRARVVY